MSSQEKSENVRKRTDLRRNGNEKLRRDQEINNPCYREHLLSLECLNFNQKDHDACQNYFTNYKNCMDFWASVQLKRRSQNIKPYLPLPEDRAQIKIFITSYASCIIALQSISSKLFNKEEKEFVK